MPRNPFAHMTEAEVIAHNARVASGKGAKKVDAVIDSMLLGNPLKQPKPKPGTLESLNKTERRFYERLTSGALGNFRIIQIHAVTLRLAWDCRYTPDVMTVMPMGEVRFWEVKGAYEREDAAIKIKMAATTFPFWTFVKAVWKNGEWHEEVVRI